MEFLKIGDLEVKYPVIQGGMGVGISLGGLAGAVAKAGGVGIISAAQIGFREPDFDEHPREANLRAIQKELDKARRIAGERIGGYGVIGYNIMVALRYYEDYVRAAIAAGADLIVSGAGLPMELPAIAQGTAVKLAPIVSTVKSAKVILKYWDKKYARIPDLLVIEGPKAGGHLGFSKDALEQYLEPDVYAKEVQGILEVVQEYEQKYGMKIPVALAGGITTAQDVHRALELGVDAVQVATRFVTTKECDADERYKQAYIRASKEDVQIVKSPVGMPGRAIMNPMLQRVARGEKVPIKKCHQCLHKCNQAEIPYCITDALIHAAKGELEDALLFCGAEVYQADRIETVQEVIDSLFA